MNLLSCKHCGVVLDKDYITFPDVFDDDYDYIKGNSEWDGDKYVAIAQCPVCGGKILEED